MKRYSVFVIAALMACTAIIIGLRSHHRKAAEMHAALDSALVQNRNYVAFTSDSLLKEVVAYFDRWGSANDRLRAHYALGCAYRDLHDAPIALLTWEDAIAAADTTSADCDYATLFRVYGQMASVYFRQYMPEKQLKAQNLFCKYALQAGDTLLYIGGLLRRNDAYLALGDTAAIYQNIANVRQLYLKRGLKAEAAQVYPMAIRIAIDQQRFTQADSMMQIFEQESGLFDEQDNIAPTREKYYYNKGMYYLGINRLDSAEYWFRRELQVNGYELNAYHGLLSLYKFRGNTDSTFKYVSLYDKALVDYLYQTKVSAIAQAEGMYDYSYQERFAQEQEKRADFIRRLWAYTILTAIVIIVFLIHRYRKNQRFKDTQIRSLLQDLIHIREEVQQKKDELKILIKHQQSAEEEMQQLLRSKEESLRKLQERVELSEKEFSRLKASEKHIALLESEIVKIFREKSSFQTRREGAKVLISNPRKPTLEEWRILKGAIKECLPYFYIRISEEGLLTEQEFLVCLLIRLDFSTMEMAYLLHTSSSRISNIKNSANQKLFSESGSSTFIDNLKNI